MWEAEEEGRVGSAASRSRVLAACLPHGLHFPCSLQAAQTKGADSFRRSWIPLSQKSQADRSFSQAYKKKKGRSKGKGSRTHGVHDI